MKEGATLSTDQRVPVEEEGWKKLWEKRESEAGISANLPSSSYQPSEHKPWEGKDDGFVVQALQPNVNG